MDKVKVLHVIASVDPRDGGPIEGTFSSSKVWSQHGHERHILSLDAPDAPWVRSAPVRIFAMGRSSRLGRVLHRIWPWFARYRYTPNLVPWMELHAEEYDAVIVNGLWNYASYGSWRALHKLKVPYFVFTHGMLDPWFNKFAPKKTILKNIFWKLFEHKVLRDARGVMFTCEEECRLASQSFLPYVAREYVVGYGTRDVAGDPETHLAAFAARVPGIQGRKFILFLSRIHPKKGVDLLIQAFARCAATFPELDLVLGGPDQTGWKSELEELAKKHGVAKRIHWPGMLAGTAKWGAFRSAEFFVLPSHQENFGIVVAEAMALGRPVLITNRVNIWREVEADGAGLVVDDNVEAISAGLLEMCALSPLERDAMGLKARNCFLTRYNLEDHAMKHLELMMRLLTGVEIL
jgi:glycosyltransferase involved in cell wall biosynthesis